MWYFVWQSQETNKRGVVFSTLSDVQRDAKTLLNDEAMAKVVKEILKKIRTDLIYLIVNPPVKS